MSKNVSYQVQYRPEDWRSGWLNAGHEFTEVDAIRDYVKNTDKYKSGTRRCVRTIRETVEFAVSVTIVNKEVV